MKNGNSERKTINIFVRERLLPVVLEIQECQSILIEYIHEKVPLGWSAYDIAREFSKRMREGCIEPSLVNYFVEKEKLRLTNTKPIENL